MAITIHFAGRLRSREDYDLLVREAAAWAAEQRWPVQSIAADEVSLYRVRDQKICTYLSSVRGLVLFPDQNCDALILEFDSDLYVQNFVKTQRAGAATHARIIELLRALAPHFEKLEVYDEAAYWESGDIDRLGKRMGDSQTTRSGGRVVRAPNTRAGAHLSPANSNAVNVGVRHVRPAAR